MQEILFRINQNNVCRYCRVTWLRSCHATRVHIPFEDQDLWLLNFFVENLDFRGQNFVECLLSTVGSGVS